MSKALENLTKVIMLSRNNSPRDYQTDDQLRKEKAIIEENIKKAQKIIETTKNTDTEIEPPNFPQLIFSLLTNQIRKGEIENILNPYGETHTK